MAGKADYGYINARVRGMKSRLLDRKTLDSLLFQPDIGTFIRDLEKTPYGPEILEAQARYSEVAAVDAALRKNLARTFRKILGFVRGTDAERYVHIFLSRWDVQNLKTILRGKKIHVTNEEITECLVPAGELDEVTLGEVIRQPDVRAVIDMLATWDIPYAGPLTRSLGAYNKEEDLAILECALDQFYYEQALASSGRKSRDSMLVSDLLTAEIDVTNIKTALRLARDHVRPEDALRFFLPGGKVFDEKKLLAFMSVGSPAEIVRELAGTPYRLPPPAQEREVSEGKISSYEKELERFLVRKGVRAFYGDPLGIAPAAGYFWAKFNEVTNLRIIARSKISDLREDEVREELTYV